MIKESKLGLLTNKIIDVSITILAFIVVPVQLLTTFILGIIVNLSFGLLLWPLSLIWIVLFLGPLLGISYLWERLFWTRAILSLLGIPLAIIGDTFVCLIPSMGEMESRIVKLLYCQTFPYTWRFHQFHKEKWNIESDNDLNIVFQRVSKDIAVRRYLEEFSYRQDA